MQTSNRASSRETYPMLAGSRIDLRHLAARALVVVALLTGLLGFFSEATYSVALVGAYYWLGTGILSALLAIALLLFDHR
jgi:hypothetical protein